MAMMGGYGTGHGMGVGAWLFMGGFGLLLLLLVGYVIVRVLPSSAGTSSRSRQETPEDVLDQRFARGEIDAETYRAQRAVLADARGRRP